jgi:hypothetical protein
VTRREKTGLKPGATDAARSAVQGRSSGNSVPVAQGFSSALARICLAL